MNNTNKAYTDSLRKRKKVEDMFYSFTGNIIMGLIYGIGIAFLVYLVWRDMTGGLFDPSL